MKRYQVLFSLAVAAIAAGCGSSNKTKCGAGTVDMGNTCVPTVSCGSGTMQMADGSCIPVCGNGLQLDPSTGECVIGPTGCPAPNVVINGVCENPDHGLTVDVEEGPEPNGLGILGEPSQNPAGTITALKAVGMHTVIHGHITPFVDTDKDGQLDPDIDSYLITITGPTLVHLNADGLGGLAAGFAVLAAVPATDPLAAWQRLGFNLASTTSARQIFLPQAGTYVLAVTDTRTLFLNQGAAGGPNAEYYITLDQLTMPSPTPLSFTSGVATVNDMANSDVHFYSTNMMGAGLNEVAVTSPNAPPMPGQINPAFVVTADSAVRVQAAQGVDPFGNPTPADVLAGGFTPATTNALIVVDDTYDYALAAVPYTLTVKTANASALCTTPNSASCNGGTATETAIRSAPPRNATFFFDLNQFYLDVTADQVTDGITITWNHPVQGSVTDQTGNFISFFSDYPAGTGTWTTYTGLMRFPTAGRYYFAIYDPTATAGTTAITATTTLAPQTVTAVAEGTTATANVTAFNSNAFSYDAAMDPWHLFQASGTGTGNLSVEWYDPKTTFGRLDNLTVTTTGTTTVPGDATAIFAHKYLATGGSTDTGCSTSGCGRIILDDGTTTFFVKVNPTTTTGTPSESLDFNKRTITDLGMVVAGTPANAANQTASPGYYLFHTPATNTATIKVTPHTAGLDRLDRVALDESVTQTSACSAATPCNDATTAVDSGGWGAFIVTNTAATAQQYDVQVSVP